MLFGMSWIKFLVCSRASLIFKTDSIKIKRDLEVKVFLAFKLKIFAIYLISVTIKMTNLDQ